VILAATFAEHAPTSAGADIPDDQVVARLSSGPMTQFAGLTPLLIAARARPDDLAAATAAAAALIESGRKAGNSRLVGAALGVLRPFLADNPAAETLRLAAEARQYQHDFTGALALLDRAIAADPQASDAILMRSTIHLVQGDLTTAEADCARLRPVRADVAFLCQSTALTMTAAAPVVFKRLEGLAATPGLLGPGLKSWAQSLMGEIALMQGKLEPAEQNLRAVLAGTPDALRERMMLADLLLSEGRAHEVTELLQSAPSVDGVLIRRALAARASGDASAAQKAEDEVAARVRQNLALGLNAHAREDAMYFLLLAGNPTQALVRARINWALQHEIDDARLLIKAADAAGQPAEALPVLAWMKDEKIVVPSLTLPASVQGVAR
jgi:tetratricopeptide (TPR) repeat protein